MRLTFPRARIAPVVAVLASALFFCLAGNLAAAPSVVATTPWTAAFAMAAGVDPGDIHVIAPYELQHPPEYELRATDIALIEDADFMIFAGYEAMVARMRTAIDGDTPVLIQIQTDHSMATIEASVMRIAEAVGIVSVARQNIARIESFLADWRASIPAASRELRVIAHAFQRAILGELGIPVVGTFGPGPLQARQIGELTDAGPDLIVDVWHNPAAGPLRETLPAAEFVALINFPGRDGTRTLIDVLRHKRAELDRALAAALD